MGEGSLGTTTLTSSRLAISNLDFANLSRSGTQGNVRFMFTLRYNNASGLGDFDYERRFVSGASLRDN
jgi:hypothetical protein